MSWVCKYCNANNDDDASNCFVCDKPHGFAFTKTLTATRVKELGLTGDVVVPEEYTAIGEGAFKYCTGITSISIHDGVTKIMKEAFCGCVNLREVRCTTKFNSIGERAFYNCKSLAVDRRPQAKRVFDQAFEIPPDFIMTEVPKEPKREPQPQRQPQPQPSVIIHDESEEVEREGRRREWLAEKKKKRTRESIICTAIILLALVVGTIIAIIQINNIEVSSELDVSKLFV